MFLNSLFALFIDTYFSCHCGSNSNKRLRIYIWLLLIFCACLKMPGKDCCRSEAFLCEIKFAERDLYIVQIHFSDIHVTLCAHVPRVIRCLLSSSTQLPGCKHHSNTLAVHFRVCVFFTYLFHFFFASADVCVLFWLHNLHFLCPFVLRVTCLPISSPPKLV